MKWCRYLIIFPLITLFSCQSSKDILTKCPLGAPSLLFYDQGDNENFVTISGAAQINAEFQQDKYDALIVDATNGLKQIHTYPKTNFRLAKLLTAGNLYLVSISNTDLPNKNSSIISFGNSTSIPYLVTNTLNKSWGSNNVSYENDVANVLAKALNNTADYYVLAEPALTTLKKQKTIKLSQKLEIPNTIIPQAALFINKNSYNNKKDKFNIYIQDLNKRINNCINNIDVVKESLNKYGDDSKVSERFGFKSQIAYSVQKNNNGFAIYPNSSKFDYTLMNKFMSNVGSSVRYTGEEFIDVE